MFGGGVYGGLWAFGDRVSGPGAYLSLTPGPHRMGTGGWTMSSRFMAHLGAQTCMLPPAGEGAGSSGGLSLHKLCPRPCAIWLS